MKTITFQKDISQVKKNTMNSIFCWVCFGCGGEFISAVRKWKDGQWFFSCVSRNFLTASFKSCINWAALNCCCFCCCSCGATGLTCGPALKAEPELGRSPAHCQLLPATVEYMGFLRLQGSLQPTHPSNTKVEVASFVAFLCGVANLTSRLWLVKLLTLDQSGQSIWWWWGAAISWSVGRSLISRWMGGVELACDHETHLDGTPCADILKFIVLVFRQQMGAIFLAILRKPWSRPKSSGATETSQGRNSFGSLASGGVAVVELRALRICRSMGIFLPRINSRRPFGTCNHWILRRIVNWMNSFLTRTEFWCTGKIAPMI